MVELPNLAKEGEVEPAPPEKTPPTVATSDVAPRRRLLLVEDHVDTAEMMQELLEERGFSVVLADSIQAALAVDLSQIDAIVSDLGLPDGSGTELLMRLKPGPGVPAIALSGYGMPSDIEASRNAGFDRHFTKPIDLDKLVDALRALLAASGTAQQII